MGGRVFGHSSGHLGCIVTGLGESRGGRLSLNQPVILQAAVVAQAKAGSRSAALVL